VTTREAAQKADALQIEFSDGTVDLGSAGGRAPGEAAPAKRSNKPKAKPKAEEGGQGSLF
jgi:exodeoxyribonuclease VII large subunit